MIYYLQVWQKSTEILMKRSKGNFFIGNFTKAYVTISLGLMSLAFSLMPKIKKQLKGPKKGGEYNAGFVFTTKDRGISVSAAFVNGKMKVRPWEIPAPDVTVIYRNGKIMRDLLSSKPKRDIFNAMLDGDMVFEGNLSHLARLSYLTTEVSKPEKGKSEAIFSGLTENRSKSFFPTPMAPHQGVHYLKDLSFSKMSLSDWPKLENLLEGHFTQKPEICPERAMLVTSFYNKNGFEIDNRGRNWDPVLRQGLALLHMLKNKEIRINDDDLLLGTTTSKRLGIPIYPEFGGIAIWPELNTVDSRRMNPYDISEETKTILNQEVFPFWIDRNIREYSRKMNDNPTCQRIEERWVLYFMWKAHAISHTIPDFPTVLSKGLASLSEEAKSKSENCHDMKKRNFYLAVAHTMDGVINYANRLADEAEKIAGSLDSKKDQKRITHLRAMSKRVRWAPALPSRNLSEAINAIWIVWTALHLENMNAGLSIGRLDLWLQPFFMNDLQKADDQRAREELIYEAIELCGALFLKCQDHLPLVPDIGNRLFGGSSSDQVITLGGVDSTGRSAVCDMTYILLKVTEILAMRDPNVNARYHRVVNDKDYLRRLLEVNSITRATPSIHNDEVIIKSLENQGFKIEDARDWSATGCVEPTSCGRHMGHTNCMMLNLVAPLEIALNNGVHPMLGEKIGGAIGDFGNGGAPDTFDDFLEIYKERLGKIIDYSIEYNNQLGIAHQNLHPTPLLSGLIQGTSESGKDVTQGGAKYNSSGAALVALTDVVDSLMTIKKLIYDQKKLSWRELLDAIENNFDGDEKLLAVITNKVPKFGGVDQTATALAQDIINFISDTYNSKTNYRGGKYTAGFWSMSNHVAFGVLSGALPSGRKKGKAFTPGITPTAAASKSILDPIHAVGSLDPLKMPNNIAFNVKLFPSPGESNKRFVDNATDLVETYIKMGGMQIQFNIVTKETLIDAVKNPAAYRNLLVRISGYNAYFIELNKDMQQELIERAEFQA